MTQEQKARAYDEALERAIKYNIDDAYACQGAVVKLIFPELRESEDERIRKEMVDYFSQYKEDGIRGVDITPWIDYLERQKKCLADSSKTSADDEKIRKQLIDAIKIGRSNSGISFTEEAASRYIAWLEKQEERKPLRWRRIEDATTQRTDDGCCVTSEKMLVKGWINDEDYRIVDEGTMVNRDILCIPVRELNAEQKEQKPAEVDESTKRLNDNWMRQHFDDYKERNTAMINGEPIPTENHSVDIPLAEWSEEDEDFINMLILHFNYLINKGGDSVETYKSYIEKLKSLRPQPKQEWSEKEKKMLAVISYKISQHQGNDERSLFTPDEAEFIDGMEDKLKSLKPSWKPSEQEKGALRTAIYVLTEERNFPKTAEQLQNILNAFE